MSYVVTVLVDEYEDQSDFWKRVDLFPNEDTGTFAVKLELDVKPEIFKDFEKLDLTVEYGKDMDLSIHAISDLGITLLVGYYPPDSKESTGCIFIPMNKVISISGLGDASEWVQKK